jgi:hypothetical protein
MYPHIIQELIHLDFHCQVNVVCAGGRCCTLLLFIYYTSWRKNVHIGCKITYVQSFTVFQVGLTLFIIIFFQKMHVLK